MKMTPFADIGIWCNGNTTDSGPVIPGSSPGIPTIKSSILSLGYGVMVPLQILVLAGSLVRVRVSQLMARHLSVMKDVFVYRNSILWSIIIPPKAAWGGIVFIFLGINSLIFCFTILVSLEFLNLTVSFLLPGCCPSCWLWLGMKPRSCSRR